MKKLKNILFSVCLSTLFMFGSFVPCLEVKAFSISDLSAYFDVNDKFNKLLWDNNQIVTSQQHMESILEKMYDRISELRGETVSSSDDLVQLGLINISVETGDITRSAELSNALSYAVNDEIQNDMGYVFVYSYGVSAFIDNFTTQEKYHTFIDFINEHDNQPILARPNGNDILIPHDDLEDFSLVKYNDLSTYGFYSIKLYSNWESFNFDEYSYNADTDSYVISTPNYVASTSTSEKLVRISPQVSNIGGTWFLVDQNSQKYMLYHTFDSMRYGSMGVQEYYTGNDFSTNNIDNSITTTQEEIDNSINYTNIVDYVNNYYINNGSYPSIPTIQIYITNYVTNPTPTPTPGGGDDNGGGSGFDWGFLGTIGDFLGGLLSGLSGVISGLLEGITGIIDLFIGSENPQTGQREGGLPSIIGQLLSYFLPFLPSEILVLIELSIVLALIIGIVKLIRGS